MNREVLRWLGIELPWDVSRTRQTGTGKPAQAVGEFCGGTCVSDCTAYFGDGLATACRTCPN